MHTVEVRALRKVFPNGHEALKDISFAVPQALVNMISYALLYWEHNIRASFIVGAVGGGGLGFEITTELNLFQYRQFTVHVIIIIVLVTVADRISAWVRKQIE
jgi:phosphonate transport system permease protein